MSGSNEGPHLKKALGLFDLTLLLIVAVVNLNLVPAIANEGVGVTTLWVLAFLFFFLPQAVAVIELSSRLPGEGGIYLWSKIPFGEFHGFISGWCYWTNNLFYIPTLLIYFVNCAFFVVGQGASPLAANMFFTQGMSIVLLWIIVGLNVRGLEVAKWVQNTGAMAAFVIVAVLVIVSFWNFTTYDSASAINMSTLLPGMVGLGTVAALGQVCYSLVGLELGSVMGDEIKGPGLNIPKAVLIAGICCIVLYVLATLAVQISVPVGSIPADKGLPEALGQALGHQNIGWMLAPLSLILSISAAGATSAWFAGSTRIPFVIGIDRYLPSSFGVLHPRYNTPYKAIIVEGAASTVIIIFNSFQATVEEAFKVLLNTSVVLQLIPFLYMFAALVKAQRKNVRSENGTPYFKSSILCLIAGTAGFVITAMGILLTFLLQPGISNYEFKLTLGCVTFLLLAVVIYLRRARNKPPEPSVA